MSVTRRAMSVATKEIGDWLSSVTAMPRADLTVERILEREAARIYIFRMHNANPAARWCVKEFIGAESAGISTLHSRSKYFQDQLARAGIHTPRVIGFNSELSTLAMTVVDGNPLEDIVRRTFHMHGGEPDACCRLINKAATALAGLHELKVPSHVPMPASCSNREYVRRWQDLNPSPFVNRCLKNSIGDPSQLLDTLQDEFWTRHESRVLHGDCQPKNFLVTDSGELYLIDLSYELGHPFHDVANFMVQLERLYRKFPTPSARRLILRYKKCFLDGYTARGFNYLIGDLSFFRLWSMTFSLMQDEEHSQIAKLYLRMIHRNRRLYVS